MAELEMEAGEGSNAPKVDLWRRASIFRSISTAEIFPFALSLASVIQGLIFAVAESTTLHKSTALVDGCAGAARWIWPSTWIVLYTAFIFGLEAVIRFMKTPHFRTRGRFNTTKCVAIIIALLFVTWIPSIASPGPDTCLGGLSWWSASHSMLAVMILSGLLVLLLLAAVLLTFQLSQSPSTSEEHVAGSDIVYYLVLNATSICFILPFFTAVTMSKSVAESSLIAEVVPNLIGLFIFCLRFCLKWKRSYAPTAVPTSMIIPRAIEQSYSSKDSSPSHHTASPTDEPPLPMKWDHSLPPTPREPSSQPDWPTRDDSLKPSTAIPPSAHLASTFPAGPTPSQRTQSSAPQITITRTPSRTQALLSALPLSPANSASNNAPLRPPRERCTTFPSRSHPPSQPHSELEQPRSSILSHLHLPRPPFLTHHRHASGSNATSATVQIGLRFSSLLNGVAHMSSRDSTHSSSTHAETRHSQASQASNGPTLDNRGVIISVPPSRPPWRHSPLRLNPMDMPTPTETPSTTSTPTHTQGYTKQGGFLTSPPRIGGGTREQNAFGSFPAITTGRDSWI